MARAIDLSAGDAAPYAGFWVRFFAAIIDLLCYAPIYIGLKYAFEQYGVHASGSLDSNVDYMTAQMPGTAAQWWFEGAFDVLSLITYAWFLASPWQGSPGMHMLKFRICDTTGERIGFGRAMYWCITATLAWVICFAGVLYMQKDIAVVNDILASCREQNVDWNDCVPEIEKTIGIPFPNYQQLMYSAAGLSLFLYLIWALSIALPKDKTGFHNLLCGTRFLKGRP